MSPSKPTPKAPAKSAAPKPSDTLTFENGDTLTGKFEREAAGTVSFQSNELGEISVPWTKIRSLHTSAGYIVLLEKPSIRHRVVADAAEGSVTVTNGEIRVDPGGPPVSLTQAKAKQGKVTAVVHQPIAVKNAPYILDATTFNRQLRQDPGFFVGWNGSVTAGVTLVQGTENQYTYASAITLVRSVPTVPWLDPRNRTTVDFSSSYGEITQPAYTDTGVYYPATYTKSSIFHADAERDRYGSTRIYGLAQTSFDHNYSQGLNLQQIYGAGVGYTAIKRPKQELDLKLALQYEKQDFITPASGTSQNLIGSTLAGTYVLKLEHGIVLNAQLSYLPAYNVQRDYSAAETSTLTIPFYKNIAFSLGTTDSYLNDPVPAEPPTTRNSFQFTSGVTYTIKSKY